MSNVIHLDSRRPAAPGPNEGTTFVRCLGCRAHVELGVDVCPTCGRDPSVAPQVAVVLQEVGPRAAALTEIGEHLYDSSGNPFCIDCGVHESEAMQKPCGRR